MNLLNLIYPQTCGICGKIYKKPICNKCKIQLEKQLNINKIEYKDKYFDSHTYMFKYEGKIREKILQYKFFESAYLYKFFAEILLNNCTFIGNYDIILAVPIHKKRLAKRGYNQSELIAKYIAKKLNIEYANDVLTKSKNNVQQSTLNKLKRIANVLGVYEIKNSQKIENKNILLIDDIYTTGSTLNECSKILKQNGANLVDVFTIARD